MAQAPARPELPMSPPRKLRRAAVATAFPVATAAASAMLDAGGTAVDAAVAAAWTLAVCEPSASGLGGQTVALLRFADGRSLVVDGHSRAPRAASPETVSATAQRNGHRAATVPSTPATLDWLLAKHGTCSRERVMAPAIDAAEAGFAITPLQHRQAAWVVESLRGTPAGDLFLVDGTPPAIGTIFRQPRLAETLRRLARCGIEDFYVGEVARLIARDMAQHGGLIDAADLAGVEPPGESSPLWAAYRGCRVVTVPPPGGGPQLLLALRILEQLLPQGRAGSEDDRGEAVALATMAAFGDREARPLPLERLTPELREHMLLDRARQIAHDLREPWHRPAPALAFAEEPGDTTHLTVADRHGNVVALTQSIQSVFGAKVAHPELGFLYNNYLRTCPRVPHPHGLGPRCRPRSNAAPTIVLHGDADDAAPALALGAAGSRRIISAILQVVSGAVDHGMDVAAAVAAPRVHGLVGGKVWIERPVASEALLRRLSARGCMPVVKPRHAYAMGAVHALQFMPDGTPSAAADPRRDGTAAVLP
jgi:gamma-glutamyltranspeptidase / glutathione hydrolase